MSDWVPCGGCGAAAAAVAAASAAPRAATAVANRFMLSPPDHNGVITTVIYHLSCSPARGVAGRAATTTVNSSRGASALDNTGMPGGGHRPMRALRGELAVAVPTKGDRAARPRALGAAIEASPPWLR